MQGKLMQISVLLLSFLCAACSNRAQDQGGTVSAPKKGLDQPVVLPAPSPSPQSSTSNSTGVPVTDPEVTPAKDPAVAWADQMAKRLESHRLVNVDLRNRLNILTDLPPDTLKEWGPALDHATGQKVDAVALYTQILVRFSPMWEGEEFLSAESQRYVGRIKQVPKDVASKWRDGFRNVTSSPVEEVDAVVMLIQMDYLYEAEQFRAARAVQLLPRLLQLNLELLQPWADALGWNTQEAAVELINNDWLFDGDQLNATVSEKALRTLRAAHLGAK